MYETSGNNAYKKEYRSVQKPAGIPYGADRRDRLVSDEHKIQRKFNKSRSHHFLMYLAAISFAALVFTGILYRQAQIMEMNYLNVKLEREISQVKTETERIKEEFVDTVDLSSIRRIAIEELGMREPASSQIVSVTIPAGDRVVIETSDTGSDAVDVDLDNMFDNLEGFFKTMR
ncbi:MAG: hypothetical protein ACYC5K_08570 [Saccharofermentanales bacterium]